MNGNELAEQRRSAKLMRRVTEALGPAGVFFQGFLEHPKMVGSIIPSSRSTIDRMLEESLEEDARGAERALGPLQKTTPAFAG